MVFLVFEDPSVLYDAQCSFAIPPPPQPVQLSSKSGSVKVTRKLTSLGRALPRLVAQSSRHLGRHHSPLSLRLISDHVLAALDCFLPPSLAPPFHAESGPPMDSY